MESNNPPQDSQNDHGNSRPDMEQSRHSGQDSQKYHGNSRPDMEQPRRSGQANENQSNHRSNYGNSRNYNQDYQESGSYNTGYHDRRYDDRGSSGRGRSDRDYSDRGSYGRGRSDRDYSDRGSYGRGYNDRGSYGRGRSDRGYEYRGSSGRGRSDRDYSGRGFNDRSSYGRGRSDRDYNDGGFPGYHKKLDDTSISRSLSTILRHQAEKMNLKMDSGGYIYVDDLLKLNKFYGVTLKDIERIVKENDKQRFSMTMDESSKQHKIRANQGHSMKFECLDLGLTPIENPHRFPDVLHGTYYAYWNSIRKEGLNKMTRVHIHFAPGVPGDDGVISGMRSTCEILIFIDMEKALQDGLKFFLSANNVILSGGDEDGKIAPKYFAKVLDRKLGNRLEVDSSSPPKKKLPVGMVEDDSEKNQGQKKNSKKKLPVGMVEDDSEKNQGQKKHSKKQKKQKDDTDKKSDSKKQKKPKKESDSEKHPSVELESKGTNTEASKNEAEKEAEKPMEAAENPIETTEELKGEPSKKETEKVENPSKKISVELESEETNMEASKNEAEKEAEKPMEAAEKTMEATEELKEKPLKKETEETKNPSKKTSDVHSDHKEEKESSPSKETESAKVEDADNVGESAPKVYTIENSDDENLNELKEKETVGVDVLRNKDEIVYILISLPGIVYVFDPTNTKGLLKTLLENEKCYKVMFDYHLKDEMKNQFEIVMYEKPVPDVQVLSAMGLKRKVESLATLVGDTYKKIPSPTFPNEKEIAAKTEKPKILKKTINQVSVLVPLYEKYKENKANLNSRETIDQLKKSSKIDDVTKKKFDELFEESQAEIQGTEKLETSEPNSQEI